MADIVNSQINALAKINTFTLLCIIMKNPFVFGRVSTKILGREKPSKNQCLGGSFYTDTRKSQLIMTRDPLL